MNMQLKNLRSVKTLTDLKAELGALKPDLKEIYRNLYNKIQAYRPFQRRLTYTALQLAVHSFHPMIFDTFLALLPSDEPSDEYLLSDSESETSSTHPESEEEDPYI